MLPRTNDEWRALGRILAINQKAFLLNNFMRGQQMFRMATPGFKTVFQSIPFFLQVNLPEVPGYLSARRDGLGLFGFERSEFVRLFQKSFPDREIKEILVRAPLIQSLSLIGSPGSIGHTRLSDLDYWVCIDESRLQAGDREFMNEKLSLITYWAANSYGVEVHFFVMDLKDIQANHFGIMDEDNSGDVLPLLIKEEFYRTMLHVAGRRPLWWVMPVGVGKDEYQAVAENMDNLIVTAFSSLDFLDLGFPDRPGPRECLGAAMWQAHKSQKDPFKAVLKMLLIRELVESNFTAPLPCDEVKAAVFASSPENLPIDPYLVIIRRVLASAGDDLEMVRLAVWFKLLGAIDDVKEANWAFRSKILDTLAEEWGWPPSKVQDLLRYSSWPERRKLVLGEQIKNLLLDLYSGIAARLRRDYPLEVLVHDANLTRLNVEILAKYTDHGPKIEDLPSDFHRRGLPHDLTLAMVADRWLIYDSTGQENDYIYAAGRAGRVAAWLVHNHIWQSELKIRIKPGGPDLDSSTFQSLLRLLHDIFPPIPFASIAGQSLLSRPQGRHVLIINLEESHSQDRIIKAEKVYRTNLGEMCHEVLSWSPQAREADKYLLLVNNLSAAADLDLKNVALFIPNGPDKEEIMMNFEAFFRSYKASPAVMRSIAESKSKLDLD
ncbi:MAG: class I adenylate cyclase [Deltaproteobacteria bacterium]|nr:class I adenylate cyclase [Deltaproteobacteria bacterium]